MPTFRDNPYGAFNFLVSLGGDQGDGAEGTIIGGFSDVSGLGIEVSYSEYRNGNEKFNTVAQGAEHAQDRRHHAQARAGRLGRSVRSGSRACATARSTARNVTITLLDEARNPVATFALRNAQPKKWTGPTLAAKGGGEVAMEELHLVHEGIEYK